MPTRSDILTVIEKRAEEIRQHDPRYTELQAFAVAARQLPHLAASYSAAEPDPAPVVVSKGAEGPAVPEIIAKRAQELREQDGKLSMAQAIAKAARENPAVAYRPTVGSQAVGSQAMRDALQSVLAKLEA